MSCVQLLKKNYVTLDLLANNEVSSELAAFPITNAYNKYRRSKVWRSQGYFKVDTSNNQIVFNDGGASSTAYIANGEYTSASAFMSAIDAAMESVGIANYSINQNANYKFVFTSDLSGGATAFELETSDPGFTAADLLGFDTASDLTGASTYTADFLRINSSEWVLWDMGIPTLPEAFILIGARNRPIKISSSATVKLQANVTNNFTNPAFEQTLTYNSEAMYLLDNLGISAQAYRFWRLLIEDQNPLGYIEVGSFFLGDTMQLDRGAPQFPLSIDMIDRSETIFSEGGQSYSEIKPKTAAISMTYRHLTKEDKEQIEDHFNIFGTNTPFFIILDSQAAFHSSQNRSIKYVKYENEPSFQLERFNSYSCAVRLREEL